MDPLPSPTFTPWVPMDDGGASVALRAVAFVLIMIAAGLAAWTAWNQIAKWRSRAGDAARRAIGHPAADPWATGDWACGRCRSLNRRSVDRCSRCRATRVEAEIPVPIMEPEPDIIPEHVAAGVGATVTLEHNEAAHTDALSGHWRLRVDGVIVGSAARRDGALALLRAVEGAHAVLFDPRGAGYAPYALPALIAAFEGPRLPFAGPCPETRPPR